MSFVDREAWWNALSYAQRKEILDQYPDAYTLPITLGWNELPYWLRRTLTHFLGRQYDSVV